MVTSLRGRMVGGVLALALVVPTLSGCEQSEEERRHDYCNAVADVAEDLTRTADEGGPGAFLEALPTLEELAEKSPGDLKDEWQIYLGALRNLKEVLADADVEPAELSDGVPKRLEKAERQRVEGAVRNARSGETQRAAQGITQQALDVCDVQIL